MPDPHLQTFLADRDTPCPSCGYSLRGLTGDRCPECNQELQLQVGLVEPRIAAFIAGLVGIGMGLGFSALLLVYACMYGLTRAIGVPVEFWLPTGIGTLVGVLLLMIWIRCKRFLSRLEVGPRWLFVVVVSTLALACPVWFMIVVR